MKKKNLTYSLASLVVIILIVGVINYATETRPLQKGMPQASVISKATQSTSTESKTTTTVKKKNCGCCADRLARYREQFREARKRKQAAQKAELKANNIL